MPDSAFAPGPAAAPGGLGDPAVWRADPAHAVVSIVELRSAGHGCEFALHNSTVELDARAAHASLELRVELEPVACARCGATLFENESAVAGGLRWSAAHCVMASASHPNLLVGAGTLSLGSLGRPVELVGSATVRHDDLYLQITGALPAEALEAVPAGATGTLTASSASLTITAQLHRVSG